MSDYKKAKQGYEDFFWDTGGINQIFTRENSEGNNINIKGLNATHLPLLVATRTLSLYDTDTLSASEVDAAITQIAASLAGIHKFTNQSILDNISSYGSGAIISTTERLKLNSISDVGSGSIITDAERSKLATILALTSTQIGILNNIESVAPPIGSYLMWSTSSVPTNYLECNGAAISRAQYSDLFGVIGTTYGVGDGSSTFNLPDMRGEFVRGWDHGAGNDPDAASRTDRGDGTTGDNIGTKQDEEVGPHVHGGWNSGANGPTGGGTNWGRPGDTDPNTGTETRPRNVAVMFCIRYQNG